MDIEVALKFIEDLLVLKSARKLTEDEKAILKGTWEDLKLDQIPGQYNLQNATDIRKSASKLWRDISRLFDPPIKVTKPKLKGIIEQQWRLRQEPEPHISEPAIITPSQNIERLTDRNFVGREEAIADLDRLVERGATCILIQSPGGVGKTVLAERYLTQRFDQPPLRFDIAKDVKNINSAEGWIEQNLRKLGEEPGREFLVSCDRLREKLQSEAIGILVDNLEPALDKDGKFIGDHRSYVELLRVLCDRSLQSLTLITSRERVCESLDIVLYPLKVLSVEAWREYFSQQELNADSPVLAEIHQAYGGNALAMNILRERIALDYERDIEDYWEIHYTEEGVSVETAVHNLLVEQFGRLESVDLMAYQLLCRMGCFRYQDVPTVPRDGLLCLLWDVPKRDASGAIERLWKRGLIERVNREYKLHPLIQQEAFERSKISEDWEKANRTAAEFWTESVKTIETVEQATKAIEAYHHYVANENFNSASKIIVKERDNPGERGEILGDSFYRLGLLKQMTNFIEKIIDKISLGYSLVKLYNILGDIEWLRGNLSEAIDFHKKSDKFSEQCLSLNNLDQEDIIKCSRIVCNSKFNIALCEVDRLNIDVAKKLLLEAYKLYINHMEKYGETKVFKNLSARHQSTGISCLVLLAFVESKIGNCLKSRDYLSDVSLSLLQSNAWLHGYGFLFLASTHKELQEYEISCQRYEHAIRFAQQINYPQVKAKALTGLAELYRIRNEFKTALNYHAASIQILEKIGAKCDLAEAYYQRGLTDQAMGNISNSHESFNRAIALWEKIDAPLQIQRVRRSMNNLS